MARGYLVLEDGTMYEGDVFGRPAWSAGEVVFSTGMSGYCESITDPAHRGHILVMTYPLVGDYGVPEDVFDREGAQIRGLVVRECCEEPSPMYHGRKLSDYLDECGIPGISGIDTRDLTVLIREKGTMKGMIIPCPIDVEKALSELRSMSSPDAENLVSEVSTKSIKRRTSGKGPAVGILDCGLRPWVVEELSDLFDVIVFPYDTPAEAVKAEGVRGLVVSDGPGDPAHPAIMGTVVETVRELSGSMPVFGIGLGCQAVALAFGAETYKMKFGHRGQNQPSRLGGRVYMTAQNHGYAIDADSLEGTGLVAEQVNVNDGTVEGVSHRELPVYGTQYLSEGVSPWDDARPFDRFLRMVEAMR